MRRPLPRHADLRILILGAVAGLGLPGPVIAAPAGSSGSSLNELRRSFTVGGKPVPPEIFRDMGDGDMADSRSIRIAVDVSAAVGSNLYADDIAVAPPWVSQRRPPHGEGEPAEETAYRFVGSTGNRLLVAVATTSGGGTGVFTTLHILDAAPSRGLDDAGKPYDRLVVTDVRSIALGDRWAGTVGIDGDRITITTTGGAGQGPGRLAATRVVEARRP